MRVKKEIDRICEVKDTAGYFCFKDSQPRASSNANCRCGNYRRVQFAVGAPLTGRPSQIAER